MIAIDSLALIAAIILLMTSPGLEKLIALLPLIGPVYNHFLVKKKLSIKKVAYACLMLTIVIVSGMLYKNTYWIKGQVLLSNKPVSGVKVTINNSTRSDKSNKNGEYSFYFFPLRSNKGVLFNVDYPDHTLTADEAYQNLKPSGNTLNMTKR